MPETPDTPAIMSSRTVTPPPGEVDLEKAESRRNSTSSNDLDRPSLASSSSSSSLSSTFSWHHAEGPRSLRSYRRTSSNAPNDLQRTTSRLDRVQTTAESTLARLRSRPQQQEFSHPLIHEKTKPNVIVTFDGPDDPYRPMNWPVKKKVIITLLYGMTAMTTSFASSAYSSGERGVTRDFHVGTEVATLGTALFIFGQGLGPLLWGPLSEVFGRKPSVILPVAISIPFTFGAGAAKDIQTVIICRFFQGFFSSAPTTNTGGVLGDLWKAESRGNAMIIYSLAVVGGPTIGPVIGSAIASSYLRWRWIQYITGIWQGLLVVLDILFVDESYGPALLCKKAQRLRHESGNWALHAEHEEWDVSISELAHKYLVRPFQLLATPICLCMCTYASFAYGLIYACLGAFPYIFEVKRGWPQVSGSLPFLALLLGVITASFMNIFQTKAYVKRFKQNGGKVIPEARLYPMMPGGIFMCAGIFMLAWTGNPAVFWFVPCIAIFMIGLGFYVIFQAAINYLIDTFQRYSASAVAANTFLRSVFAGAFPLFITYQLEGIGIGWGLSVYAFIAALMMPIPFVFYIYGRKLRSMNKWSMESVTD